MREVLRRLAVSGTDPSATGSKRQALRLSLLTSSVGRGAFLLLFACTILSTHLIHAKTHTQNILIVGHSWAEQCPLAGDRIALHGASVTEIRYLIMQTPDRKYDKIIFLVGGPDHLFRSKSVEQIQCEVVELAYICRAKFGSWPVIYDPAKIIHFIKHRKDCRCDLLHLNEKGWKEFLALQPLTYPYPIKFPPSTSNTT